MERERTGEVRAENKDSSNKKLCFEIVSGRSWSDFGAEKKEKDIVGCQGP